LTVKQTRRDAILAAVSSALTAAATAGFPPSLWAQAEVMVDEFLTLSQRLTGASGLDRSMAQMLLGGFLASGNGPGLRALVHEPSGSLAPLADAIVAAWYSGVYDTGSGQAVADFTGALVWNALDFTKPFAVCGGDIGYWADPPQA
jgi:Membrane bound FAD containing D-sorbitol dehydrogenase